MSAPQQHKPSKEHDPSLYSANGKLKVGLHIRKSETNEVSKMPDQSWANVDGTTFETRVGPDYATNKKKVASKPTIYECFTDDHELLTERGWYSIDALQQADAAAQRGLQPALRVATLNPTDQQLQYRPYTGIVDYEGVHEIVDIKQRVTKGASAGTGISLSVTGNHDLYARMGSRDQAGLVQWEQETIHKIKARDVVSNDAHAVMQLQANASSGVAVEPCSPFSTVASRLQLESEQMVMDFLHVYGYALRDQCMQLDFTASSPSLVLTPSSLSDLTYLQSILTRLPVQQYSVHRQQLTISIQQREWVNLFGNQYRGVSEDCRVLFDWVLTALSKQQLRSFIKGLSHGTECIYTSSATLRDQLITVLLHAGYAPHFESSESGWTVRYSESEQDSSPILSRSEDVTTRRFEGRVWCVTVPPFHLIVVRRQLSTVKGVVTEASKPVIVGQCVAVDLFVTESKISHVGRFMDLPGDHLDDSQNNGYLPQTFIVNFQIPNYPVENAIWGQCAGNGHGYSIVFYFVLSEYGRQEVFRRGKLESAVNDPHSLFHGILEGKITTPRKKEESAIGGLVSMFSMSNSSSSSASSQSAAAAAAAPANHSHASGASYANHVSPNFYYSPTDPKCFLPTDAPCNSAVRLLHHFVAADEGTELRHRFKAITRMMNTDSVGLGSASKKLVTMYNGTPFLIRTCSVFWRGEKYFEVDVDVHRFSYTARLGLGGVKERIKDVVFDFGFVIEGHSDFELPENMLGSVRLSKLDLTQAKPFPM